MVRLPPAAAPQLNHPLGYLYLGAALRRRGFWNLRLLDLAPARLTDDDVVAEAVRARPAVVFLTLCTVDLPAAERLGARLAAACPGAVFVAGGSHVTGDPEGTLAALPFVRFAVSGEGEATAVELLERLGEVDGDDFEGVAGLAFRRRDGEIAVNPPRAVPAGLDDSLWPAYDLVHLPSYFHYPRMGGLYRHPEYMSLFTSRGCSYACEFCHEVFGRRFRAYSPERVLDEMEYLVAKHGIREFQVIDDLFNGDRARTLAICEGIRRRNLHISLAFPNGLRTDRLDDEEIDALVAAGTWRVCVSPETASARLQEESRKHADLGRIEHVIDAFDRRNVVTSGFFMLGFPTETEDELDATIAWALRSRLHIVNFFRVIPMPGTRLRERVLGSGQALDQPLAAYEALGSSFNLSAVPLDVIERKQRDAIRAFYSDPRRLLRLARLLPLRAGLLPAYAYELLVRTAVGTYGTHLVTKAARADGARAVLDWLRIVSAGPST